MPPPLPRELLEQIMASPDLDKQTLARCALLSRDWLDFARRHLYRDLHFTLYDNPRAPPALRYAHDSSSLKLLVTLDKDVGLGDLVRGITFSSILAEEHRGPYAYPPTLLGTLVHACPNVDMLDLHCEVGIDLERVLFHRRCAQPWVELRLAAFNAESFHIVDYNQSHLQTLIIDDRFGEGHDLTDVLDSPHALSDNGLQLFRALTYTSQFTLVSLLCPFDPSVCTDLSLFSCLRDLTLLFLADDEDDYGVTDLPELLRSVPQLDRLRLEHEWAFDSYDIVDLLAPGPEGFVSSLPPSLVHLTLPAPFAPDDILELLPLLDLPRLHTLGYQINPRHVEEDSDYASDDGSDADAEEDRQLHIEAEEACSARGINLKLIKPYESRW
ncbi:hypothetical protein JCM10207_006932 [Rhodosporidiobolus poonsookiae]